MVTVRQVAGELILKDKASRNINKLNKSMNKAKRATDKATTGVQKLSAATDVLKSKSAGLSSGFKKLGAAIAGGAITIIGFKRVFGGLIADYARQEKVEARLVAGLKNVKDASADAAQQLIKQARALQRVTTFGDEAIIGAQGMLATFQLNEKAIMALTPRLLDMAVGVAKLRGEEMDLQGSVMALGKAFTSGVGMLSRYGVAMTKADQKAFQLADQQEKLVILTRILDENFAGLAKGLAVTGTGALDQFANRMGDVREEMGKLIVKMLLPLLKHLNKAIDLFWALSPAMRKVVIVVALLSTGVGLLIPLFVAIAIVGAKVALIIAAVAAVIIGLTAAIAASWDHIKAFFSWIVNYVRKHDKVFKALALLSPAGGLLLTGALINKIGGREGKSPTPRQFGGPVVPGRQFIVGEKGPEVFTPSVGGDIEPGPMREGATFSFGDIIIQGDGNGMKMAQNFMDALNSLAPRLRIEAGI